MFYLREMPMVSIRHCNNYVRMSIEVYSEKCGFYQTYLSRIENGNANPSLNAIEVIANSLDLSVFELFYKIKETQIPK